MGKTLMKSFVVLTVILLMATPSLIVWWWLDGPRDALLWAAMAALLAVIAGTAADYLDAVRRKS